MSNSGVRVRDRFCKHIFTFSSLPENLILTQREREKRAYGTKNPPRSPVTYPRQATSQVKVGPLLQNAEGRELVRLTESSWEGLFLVLTSSETSLCSSDEHQPVC